MRMQAARGGEEARLFMGDLCKIYERHFKRAQIGASVIETRRGAILIGLSASSERLAELSEREAGEHIVQRKTRSRRRDRIHTSSVWVSIIPIETRDQLELEEIRSQLEFETFRGHGAGGQHRNKKDTAVRARHAASGITCEILSGRSQRENKERAAVVVWERLREREAEASHARREALRADQRERVVRTYDLVRGVVRDRRRGKAPWKRVQTGELGAFK